MKNQISVAGSRIVVGVDGSPQSILALRWAQTLAPTLGAAITAVTAWHLETIVVPYAIDDWDPEADAQQLLADAVAEAFGEHMPEGFTALCQRGQPAQVLIEQSKSAGMLIVGSRGHGGFAGMLLGSVSSACAEHASCPVLVVHSAQTASSPPSTRDTDVEDVREPADSH
jgi:nucleotide-binding universal stress UspA family protein